MEPTTGKGVPLRALLLICTPKLADKAEKVFHQEGAPLLFRLHAVGTASSEMMDILGLGSIDKSLLVSALPKPAADRMLPKLYKDLKLALPGSGIACTIPLSGANAWILKLLQPLAEGEGHAAERKDGNTMADCKHMLVAAVVNQGYSEQVMDAARAAGAGGGSVLHSRHIMDGQEAVSFWGLNVQEEKELVLILASKEDKLPIMTAIKEACGIHSEAQGIVVSLPIDEAMGLGDAP